MGVQRVGELDIGVTAVMLPELDFEEQIRHSRAAGVRYYQYRPRVIPAEQAGKPFSPWGNHKFDLTPHRLVAEGRSLTARLREAGIEPWGTLPQMPVDAPDDEIKRHLEGAAAADAGRVRCQPLPYPAGPFDYGELMSRNVERFSHVVEHLSEPMGLRLIIETHCRTLTSGPGLALNICRHFPPDHVGVIFDVANFGFEGALAPNLAVAALKDYIDCVHIGGSRRVPSGVDALGAKVTRNEFCPMEEADLHLPTWVKALHEAGVRAPLIIEDFTPSVSGAERLARGAAFLTKVLKGLGKR